jgi:hypothetical protein
VIRIKEKVPVKVELLVLFNIVAGVQVFEMSVEQNDIILDKVVSEHITFATSDLLLYKLDFVYCV